MKKPNILLETEIMKKRGSTTSMVRVLVPGSYPVQVHASEPVGFFTFFRNQSRRKRKNHRRGEKRMLGL